MTEKKTEKEKMLAELPYDSWDKEILRDRKRAKAACHKYNLFDPNKYKERHAILAKLIQFSGRALIEPNFWMDYGYNISIGDNFYANHNLTILDVCEVRIGSNVFIGPNVLITGATHPLNPIERRSTESGLPISIGNDVWIGGNAVVLPGITIGDNCTIGAGSVVTKDIPANSVAVGNPARVIKTLQV
jgi:maltose O-acetyltransferase